MNDRRIYLGFFVALLLIYISFSPLSVGGLGYMDENLAATMQASSRIVEFVTGSSFVFDAGRLSGFQGEGAERKIGCVVADTRLRRGRQREIQRPVPVARDYLRDSMLFSQP